MAGEDKQKKRVKHRADATAPSRQQPVTPKWGIIDNTDPRRVVLNATGHVNNYKAIDPESLRAAARDFPGKEISFYEPEKALLHLDKSKFVDRYGDMTDSGKAKYRSLADSGQKFTMYTMPALKVVATEARQGGGSMPVIAKPSAKKKSSSILSKKAKVVKIVHKKKEKKEVRTHYYQHKEFRNIKMGQKYKMEGRTKVPIGKPFIVTKSGNTRHFSQRYASQHDLVPKFKKLIDVVNKHKPGSKTRANAIAKMIPMVRNLPGSALPGRKSLRQQAKEFLRGKVPRKVVGRSRFQHGDTYVEGKYKLGRYQMVVRSGENKGYVYNTSIHRAAGRERDAMRRDAAKRAKELKRRTKLHEHQGALIRRRLRRPEKAAAFFARSAMLAKQRAIAAQQAFAKRMSKFSGYGRVPLKMLNSAAGYSGRAAGKSGAIASVGRDVLYPARDHATARTPAFLSRMLSPASGSQTLGEAPSVSRIRGTELFSTANTVQTGKFPGGGAGVFFRIDASSVLENLTVNYPAAVRRGALAASNLVGRKLLDIVEPYVPKDTGLLYSTSKTNVAQTSGSLVDMEDGEAYPSEQMFGVSISYNAPYAEMVYFDESKRHGSEYNEHYGTSEKGEKETARWIEVAFEKEGAAIGSLLNEYAAMIEGSMNAVNSKTVRK